MSVLTDDLISPVEAARRLNVSSESVRRWIASGELRGIRLGSGANAKYRVSQADLEAFVRPAYSGPEAA